MAADTAVTPVDATNLAGTVSHDMSLTGLFLGADPIVMFIMVLLILMSILSWSIMIDKWLTFRSLDFKTKKFESDFWSADALDEFYQRTRKRKGAHPMVLMFQTAMEEWGRSRKPRGGNELSPDIKQRMNRMMVITRNRELDKIEKGIGFLGTAGSSAPFIGLLGTVIGIMNSFTSIAGSQNTSLTVVAPGIAEALFATAIGLFVAIPAVIGYNKFSQHLARYTGRLDDFAEEFTMLLSRQSGA